MTGLTTDLVRTARLTPTASYQRLGYVVGAILVLSGVFHAGVYVVDGGPWQGPVSWRKPTVFGLSFGLTLLTLTWFMTFLRPRKVTGWGVITVLAMASAGEVILISMQQWRGVPSHFNESTAFNGLVFSAMGFLVALVALMTVVVAVRSFLRMDAPASLAWAVRAGLVLMLVSQAVGVQMIAAGGNTFGESGALKVPHAVTLHAVQVLPALAVVLQLSSFAERRRVKIVALGVAGYAVMIASTMVQTYGGRSPLDLDPFTSALALVGIALLGASVLLAVRALGPRIHPPGSSSMRPA